MSCEHNYASCRFPGTSRWARVCRDCFAALVSPDGVYWSPPSNGDESKFANEARAAVLQRQREEAAAQPGNKASDDRGDPR